ncbi:uncharacterized protein EI90DRAFT_2826951, partial [Cantharellus anzutake]|uniref:uncharacterized protein n=1 Tax=Cantharellus anzutake TaxID=1750568 RepID=UPI001906568F
NARSYYRWFKDILTRLNGIHFDHVKAHTQAVDMPSVLNRAADHAASLAHSRPSIVPLAPLPTFTMDAFSLWRPFLGFIENNVLSFASSQWSEKSARHLFWTSHQRMPGFQAMTSPSFPYERTSAGFSACVQLYARSGQLPTRALLHARGLVASAQCRLGCISAESMHHLFSECPVFRSFRISAVSGLCSR